MLYIGGGNARKIDFEPPAHVKIVSNTAGITGGVACGSRRSTICSRGEPMADQSRISGGAMKALTVGGAMIDTIAIIASDRIERMSMMNADSSFLLLEEGRKTEALEISTHVGGGAVNAAVAMARLGLDVAALVKLGKDARAETVLSHLLQEGVSTRWAMRDGRAPTGPRCWCPRTTATPASSRFAAPIRCSRRPTCARRRSPPTSSTSPRSATNSADAFPAIVQRAKAQGALVATNPRVRQLSSRGGAFQESAARISISWPSTAPRPTCWCRGWWRASAKAARRCR